MMPLSGISPTDQEDGVPALELVWHTIVKSDGTPVRVLGPKDLTDLLAVQTPDTSFQSTHRVPLPRHLMDIIILPLGMVDNTKAGVDQALADSFRDLVDLHNVNKMDIQHGDHIRWNLHQQLPSSDRFLLIHPQPTNLVSIQISKSGVETGYYMTKPQLISCHSNIKWCGETSVSGINSVCNIGIAYPVVICKFPQGRYSITSPSEIDEEEHIEVPDETQKVPCKYYPTKRGCRRPDCKYFHTPKNCKVTQNHKPDTVENSAGANGITGPRAIITRGKASEKAERADDASLAVDPPSAQSPKAIPEQSTSPVRPISILTRRASEPSQSAPQSSTPPSPTVKSTIVTSSVAIPSVTPELASAASADIATDYAKPRGVKEFCTYWIRTGRCDFYNQQGCAYSHDKDAYYAKYYPPKPPTPPRGIEVPGRHYPRRGDIIRHPVTLTIRTHSLPTPLVKSKSAGSSPTKKSQSKGKNSSRKSTSKSNSRKFVIRRATVELENSLLAEYGEPLNAGKADSDSGSKSQQSKEEHSETKQNTSELVKAAIDDASFLRLDKKPQQRQQKQQQKESWKLIKKPGAKGAGVQFGKGNKGKGKEQAQQKKGATGGASGVLLPGIESQTGMKVDLGGVDDLIALDDGSVAGSALELKSRK
ncbi:hypothetical protein BDZ91DRAFT_778840 [Kalaharituber pfeilii]|nr:hypothetical protein BDZ91DRAFT_778840 [Kalaharituber pfeilii]